MFKDKTKKVNAPSNKNNRKQKKAGVPQEEDKTKKKKKTIRPEMGMEMGG